ncbi:hypothetical protein MPSEU_000762900 [Mayamaea pseudoterrestris]|nr:hypothetical protein MPSEU_000762900 [Mayamaea pseudoterrestris]
MRTRTAGTFRTSNIPRILAWLAFVTPHVAVAQTLSKKSGSIFFQGSLGTVQAPENESNPSISGESVNANQLLSAALETLTTVLQERSGATGRESIRPGKHKNRMVADQQNHKHLRYEQTYQALEVVDAAIVMHLNEDNQVYAIHGEFVTDGSVDMNEKVTCEQAFNGILENPKYQTAATWLTDCDTKIVIDGRHGDAHKAWVRMIGYQPAQGLYQKTLLYASVVTGDIVATRPQVMGAMALRTENCNNSFNTYRCKVVSTSNRVIKTRDKVINDAHNNARIAYKFYRRNFGRDSLDDQGIEIVSQVHVGRNYNNAAWDGYALQYGDGDGELLNPLSRALDVVGHEYTHGVTDYTSGLIGYGDSGALNEAISDIMGACMDRQEGASVKNTWLLGEEVWTPGMKGDALRYLNDPTRTGEGETDYYPDRYQGDDDNGGVHWNSGIVSLAFVLMVQGGTHPRGMTDIVVPAIHPNFDTSLLAAANIFYMANTACLTPASGFYEIRECTLLHAGAFATNVEAAWDAVGCRPAVVSDGIPIVGLSAEKGDTLSFLYVGLLAGKLLSCTLEGDNGDADLYMEINGPYFATDSIPSCLTEDFGSVEACAVGPSDHMTTASIIISAYSSFNNLKLSCASVDSAWNIIQNGVPATELRAKIDASLSCLYTNIPALASVKCSIEAPDVIPSVVEVSFVDDKSAFDYNYDIIDEGRYNQGVAEFTMQTLSGIDYSNMRLSFFAYSAGFEGVTLTCTVEPQRVTAISNWVVQPEANIFTQDIGVEYIYYYTLDVPLEASEQVSCFVKGSKHLHTGLSIYFGRPADATDSRLACASSVPYDTNFAECLSDAAEVSTEVYARVYAVRDLTNDPEPENMEVVCGKKRPTVSLSDGVALPNQDGVDSTDSIIRVYQLANVLRGAKMECHIEGTNGDADLYVRQGGMAHPLSGRNDCEASTPSMSNEVCETQVISMDTTVYATVYASESYSGLSITCSQDKSGCKTFRQPCRKALDCCGHRTRFSTFDWHIAASLLPSDSSHIATRSRASSY